MRRGKNINKLKESVMLPLIKVFLPSWSWKWKLLRRKWWTLTREWRVCKRNIRPILRVYGMFSASLKVRFLTIWSRQSKQNPVLINQQSNKKRSLRKNHSSVCSKQENDMYSLPMIIYSNLLNVKQIWIWCWMFDILYLNLIIMNHGKNLGKG